MVDREVQRVNAVVCAGAVFVDAACESGTLCA